MKKLIIILYPFKFRQFDWERFEIDKLKKKNNVLIFDFINILYPHFSNAYFKDHRIKKKIESVKNIVLFENKIFQLFKNYKKENILILNFIKNDSVKSIKINYFIKELGFKNVSFFNPGVSTFNLKVSKNNNFKKILTFILNYKNEALQKIKGKFLDIIVNIFKIHPDYLLVAGSSCKNKIKNYCKKNNIKIIHGHSWDFSSILVNKLKKNLSLKNYAVYLDAPGPKFLSDSYMFSKKFPETVKHTYPSLNNFFSYLELKKRLKVVIAPHPKTRIKDKSSLFNYRRVISNKTQELIKDSKFIITRNSTAVIFAAYYKKPIILFYTNETINTASHRQTINLAKSLNVSVVNINKFKSIDLKKVLKIDKNIYDEYLLKYCTTKHNKSPNYKLITNLLIRN